MTRPMTRVRIGPILVAVLLTGLLLWMIAATADILLLLFLAILLALYLGAVRDYFMRRLRLPETVAFWMAVVGTIAAGVGLLWLLVPPVLTQTRGLISTLPGQMEALDAWATRVLSELPGMTDIVAKLGPHPLLGEAYSYLSGRLPSFFGDVSKRVISVLGVTVSLFTVAVMSVYLALYPGVYREWLIVLFPPLYRDLVRDVLDGLADTLRSYIVGQLSTMFILGGLTALGLAAVGVPYWLTFGVFSGIAALVPVFGVLLATILPALFVLGMGQGLTKAVLVIGVGVLVHVIDGNFVSPIIMSKRVDLPPALTILAVLIAGSLLGPLGLLVAVPLLASVMVVVRRILIDRIYEGRGFRRRPRDRPLVLRVPADDGSVWMSSSPAVDMIALEEAARG